MTAPTRDPGELSAWLRLMETPGLGRSSLRRLLAAFGEPRSIFERSAAEWARVVGPQGALALGRPPEHLDALLTQTRLWLKEDERRSLLLLGDPDYPPALLETADPPLLLYLWGQRQLLSRPMLAMVGSRNASPQGLDNALTFARTFSEGGHCVVSGLALGIDAAAHEGALSAAGSTLAVLGTGLNQLYPRRNTALALRIAERGLLMSEYALDTPALSPHFPVRNRIIAGLSEGCLVVEAALQSGSLITARLAGEAGREVFAIPGSIHSPLSRGCHALIRQGAKLVESASDVLEELPHHSSLAGAAGIGREADARSATGRGHARKRPVRRARRGSGGWNPGVRRLPRPARRRRAPAGAAGAGARTDQPRCLAGTGRLAD